MENVLTDKIDKVIEKACEEILDKKVIAEDLKALAALITARAELKTCERIFVSGGSNHNCY